MNKYKILQIIPCTKPLVAAYHTGGGLRSCEIPALALVEYSNGERSVIAFDISEYELIASVDVCNFLGLAPDEKTAIEWFSEEAKDREKA